MTDGLISTNYGAADQTTAALKAACTKYGVS